MNDSTNKTVEVKIGEASYPARVSMGAMLFAKRDFGFNAISDLDDIENLIAFLYCCCKATAIQNKKEFDITIDEFACNISAEEFTRYSADLFGTGDAEEKKS